MWLRASINKLAAGLPVAFVVSKLKQKEQVHLRVGFRTFVAINNAIALDYIGVVHLIPNFNQEANTDNTSRIQPLPSNNLTVFLAY